LLFPADRTDYYEKFNWLQMSDESSMLLGNKLIGRCSGYNFALLEPGTKDVSRCRLYHK